MGYYCKYANSFLVLWADIHPIGVELSLRNAGITDWNNGDYNDLPLSVSVDVKSVYMYWYM